MAFYKQDIVDVNLETGVIHRSFLNHTIGHKDDDADRFGIRAFRNGDPVDLSGAQCQAVFMAPDGTNIALTSYGTVSGNEAYVTLPQACYNVEGQFCLAIKLVGGGVTATVRIIDGVVDRTGATGAVAPTEAVPTYQEILAVYAEMQEAIADYESVVANQNDQINSLKSALSKTDNAVFTSPMEVDFTIQANGISAGGYNLTNSARCRTSYITNPVSIPYFFKLTDPEYRIVSAWAYEDGAIPVRKLPATDSEFVYYRQGNEVGFRASFCHASDSTQEVTEANRTAVASAIKFYTFTDKTLTLENAPADAKKVGDELFSLEKGITKVPNAVNFNVVSGGLTLNGYDWADNTRGRTSYIFIEANKTYLVNLDSDDYQIIQANIYADRAIPIRRLPFYGKTILVDADPTAVSFRICFAHDPDKTDEVDSDDLAAIEIAIKIYNLTDNTLSVAGAIADAKVVGDKFASLVDTGILKNVMGSAIDPFKKTVDFVHRTTNYMSYEYDSTNDEVSITNTSKAKYPGLETLDNLDTMLIPGEHYRLHARVKSATGTSTYAIGIKGVEGDADGRYAYASFNEYGEATLDFIATEYNKRAILYVSYNDYSQDATIVFTDVWLAENYGAMRNDETMRHELELLKSARQLGRDPSASPLTILYIGDIHGDTLAYNRIFEKAGKYAGKIDDMICVGDMVYDTSADTISSWWNEKMMTCIGNHDSATKSGDVYNWTGLSMADRAANYIAPYETGWGITHTSGTSYYYKDYASAKVRLIVIDCMLYTDEGTEAETQTAWLSGLLDDAITNNLHVLIASHAPHDTSLYVHCSFSKLRNEGDTLSEDHYCDTPDVVVNLVSAKITAGLNFVGYICGHRHQDDVLDCNGDGKQLMFDITCAAVAASTRWNNSDMNRNIFTDAFNLLTVDTVHKRVKLIRGGGADVTELMNVRKQICFNYETGELLGEML